MFFLVKQNCVPATNYCNIQNSWEVEYAQTLKQVEKGHEKCPKLWAAKLMRHRILSNLHPRTSASPELRDPASCKSSVTSLTTTLAPSSIPFSPKGNTWGLPSCCIPLFHPRSLKHPLKTLTSFPQHPTLVAASWAPSFCFLGGQTN